MRDKGTIILNNVFAGNYGLVQGNLPHEVINFFKDDDGYSYIYLSPYGVINSKYDVNNIRAVLFVRSIGNNILEVLSKAVIGEESELYTKGIALSNDGSLKTGIKDTAYQEYINSGVEDIKYGKMTVKDLHASNLWDNEVHVTMKVDEICFAKKPIYITLNKNMQADNLINIQSAKRKKLVGQKMIAYFDEYSDDKDIYQQLVKIIDNNDLWADADKTPLFQPLPQEKNLFQILHCQNKELFYSNFFSWIFEKYPQLFQEFCRNVLSRNDNKDKIEIEQNFLVEREKENIDIRILSQKYYIIIENKIKSHINGIQISDKEVDIESQLSKYVRLAKKKNEEDIKNGLISTDREIRGFVFVPDYNVIDISKYKCAEYYDVVTYSSIYQFFDSQREYKNDIYYLEFLKVLKKHTDKVDNELRDSILLRMASRIKNS